jgi:hypothetical protein
VGWGNGADAAVRTAVRRPAAFAVATGNAGASIFVLDLVFVAGVFELVAFAFIELLLVSAATFAAVHQ